MKINYLNSSPAICNKKKNNPLISLFQLKNLNITEDTI